VLELVFAIEATACAAAASFSLCFPSPRERAVRTQRRLDCIGVTGRRRLGAVAIRGGLEEGEARGDVGLCAVGGGRGEQPGDALAG
jgi:hypothetical protein